MALTRPRYSQIPDSDYKNSCRIVTTTNVTLTSGAPQTYDGVTLIQYDRVLVAGQTDKTQNGIYSVSTLGSGSNGTWVRSKDANANDRLTAGMNTFIEEGTYTGQFWHLLTPGPIVLGVTELIFGQISGNAAGTSSQVQYNLNGSIAGAANLRYDYATGNVLIGGGTAATSNVTGALTVNGGIGVTGEIWAQGNIYSVGSRVLTAYDLQTRTFTANYISKDPANVSVPTVGTGTIYGTHNFGNLAAISTYGDYNTTAESGYYSVNDASGAPGFIVYVGFTGITTFNRAVFNINYTQLSGHTVTLDFYNYDTDAWDPFATYSGLGNWQAFTLGVIDADPYIDVAGNVTTRIYHVSNGNTAHRTWIDYVALEQSITGGQGPRGATGATGPSGTYTGGYVSGITTFGSNLVANSGTTSTNTTTGALVVTGQGGAGIGGNVNVGGNVSADKFYTTNGLFWAGNGLAFSSGLEVSEINTANALSNISTQVTSIRFDKDTGFSVTELDPGNIKVSLGSSFKTWHVPGQTDLVAVAEDEVTFFGNGIDITTNPVYPKAITFISNNMLLEANIGAFYNYANANIGSIYNHLNTLDANVGAFELYANANIGTLYLGNISTQANLGAFQAYANTTFATGGSTESLSANLGAYQLYANANIGSIYNQLNTLDANVGAFEIYANANIGTLYLGNISTNANLGAYQTWANLEINGALSEIDALYTYIDSNAAIQASNLGNIVANLNSITVNLGAFEAYANTKIGNNSNSNLVIRSTEDAVSALTGALVVAGGAGIGGNLYVAGNIFASNLISIDTTTLVVQDPLLYLNADNPFPYNYDIGFYSHFVGGSPSHYQHTGIVRDYATGVWGIFSNVRAEPGSTIAWSNVEIIYDTVKLGDLIVSNTTQSTSTTSGALRVAGGAGIAGELYIANTGDVSANIGKLFLGNASTNANLGAYQTYANNAISSINVNLTNYQEVNSANIGSIYNQLNTLDANVGAFEIYANANIGSIYNQLNTLDANVGTLFLGNASTQANIGAYQLYSNANIGSIYNQLNTLDANVGAFEIYANANIGTLFLGNASTNANLGAFQTYANATFTTYSNANVTAYLPTHTGNIGANGITSSGNINVYAGVNKGYYVFGTDFAYGDLKITDDTLGSAYLIFLNAPSFTAITSLIQIGDTITIDYGSPQTTTIAGNLEVVPNDPYIGSYPNSLGFRLTDNFGITGQPDNNVGTITIPTYKNWQFRSNGWLSAPATIAASNIVVASDTTTNKIYVNEGLFWSGNGFSIINTGGGGSGTPGGTNAQIQYNDGGAFNGANITFNKSNGNVIISSVSNSSSKTTGALVVKGGVGVAGNVTADKFYTTSGLFWSANNERVTTRYTASTSAPTVPLVGDHWYNTSTDVLYEYVLDGTTSYWVDIITPAISTLSTPVVTYIGETFAGNLIIAGNITGSLGFLLEKTNIAPISPPTITDIDVLTCPITFFVSNATSNITANLRGNATTPLNDVVANGQSATFSIFFPQATPYYVNQVYIDNILIDNVAWQGTVPVTSGNADSVDLYTFTAIKGSVNNWRVFASQTNYTHSGEWSNYREMIFAVEYLLVAGGGSGATSYGGGGGGGGVTNGNISITQGRTYTITVGAGGAAVTTTNTLGVQGGNSQISGTGLTTVSATGGGFGARQNSVGGDGGSGGGGGGRTSGSGALAGGASSPVTSPVQGYAGGAGFAPVSGARGAGGGGGAGAVGTAGTGIAGGDGGAGTNTYSVWTTATSTGASGRLAGGGGGGTVNALYPGGAGGAGGGGAGNAGSNNSATAGTPNTGGGGGGMGDITTSASSGAGGSGLVILRYLTTWPLPYSTSGSPTLITSGGYRYYVWTGDGTITF